MKTSKLRFIPCFGTMLVLTSGVSAQSARNFDLGGIPMTGFGSAVALVGDEVFVGRPGEFALFPMPASQAGGVHVFSRASDGEWLEAAIVSSEDAGLGEGFGAAIATDGRTLVVGSPKASGGTGSVYVFERTGSSWEQRAVLTHDGLQDGAGLGAAVAFANGAVLAGAPGAFEGSGAVVSFRQEGGEWQSTTLRPTAGVENGRFGGALAAAGNHLVVGAPGPLPLQILGAPAPPIAGSAYVFRHEQGSWVEEGQLTSSQEGIVSLGHAVAIRGNRAAVGAPISGGGAGAVQLFERDGSGSWRESGSATPAEPGQGALFGFAVALGDADLMVGAPMASRTYAFRHDAVANAWNEQQQLSADLIGMTIFLGGTIALGEGRVVVGAPGADFFQGVGVVFNRNGMGEWIAGSTLADDIAGFESITGEQVDCEEGTAGMFECTDVDLVAFLPVADLGAERGITVNDVWGWTDSLTGKEYAIVGRSDATTFIDVSVPENPVYLGALPLTEGANVNIWRDIKVYSNHAYIVADAAGAHGVQIFDLTQLRSVTGAPRTFTETAHYDGIFSAHNIVINERTGFAFAVGSSGGGETCGGGLHMIDIREPTAPKFAGCFSDPNTGNARTGYSHDAQCIVYNGPDTAHSGKEICFGSNETALAISDVTDKESPVAISSASYPSVVYAHQGWVSEDHRHFFQNDEGDELVGNAPRTRTLIWDIEDLDDPVLLMEYMGPTQSSDHNLYVKGDFMYQSNYVSGLRVVDISDPGNPIEVGYFDTVPYGENAPGFAGSWSNFPFFDSGTIVVTSMWEGVFILKKRDTRPIP